MGVLRADVDQLIPDTTLKITEPLDFEQIISNMHNNADLQDIAEMEKMFNACISDLPRRRGGGR